MVFPWCRSAANRDFQISDYFFLASIRLLDSFQLTFTTAPWLVKNGACCQMLAGASLAFIYMDCIKSIILSHNIVASAELFQLWPLRPRQLPTGNAGSASARYLLLCCSPSLHVHSKFPWISVQDLISYV